MPKVPGHTSFDLTKAKAVVKQLGGLTFTSDGANIGSGAELATALLAEFRAAGRKMTEPGKAVPVDRAVHRGARPHPGRHEPGRGHRQRVAAEGDLQAQLHLPRPEGVHAVHLRHPAVGPVGQERARPGDQQQPSHRWRVFWQDVWKA